METFEEKLLKSFDASLEENELNEDLIEYLLKAIINEAVEYDMDKNRDLSKRAKAVTNSLIAKGEELKI